MEALAMINQEFWKNKNVLVTGHTGFKGSWLSLWLKLLGGNLYGISKSIPTNPSLFDQIQPGPVLIRSKLSQTSQPGPLQCSNAKLGPRYFALILDTGLASAGARSDNNFDGNNGWLNVA